MSNTNLKAELSSKGELLTPLIKKSFCRPCNVEISSVKRSWSELRCSGDIKQLLLGYQVTRLELYGLIGSDYALQIETDAIYDVLRGALDYQIPIMVTVGEEVVLQTYQGLIGEVISTEDWISIQNGQLNFHLQQTLIHSAWIVKKPSLNGMHISLEMFDQSGSVLAIVCGSETYGEVHCKWRKLLEQVGAQSSF